MERQASREVEIQLLAAGSITSWTHASSKPQVLALLGFSSMDVDPTMSVIWLAVLNEYFGYDMLIKSIRSLAYGQDPMK